MTPAEFWEFAVAVESDGPIEEDDQRTWVSCNDPEIGTITVIHTDRIKGATSPDRDQWNTAHLSVEMGDQSAGIVCNNFDADDNMWLFEWTKRPTDAFCVEMVLRFDDLREDTPVH